ncbi:MAG: DUF523 and DUF1722 domain-containing protein [Spirochaetes bacterium]|nr:DUF523 and DUF1722 domain-containing protein [Spirochaetota bacterium]
MEKKILIGISSCLLGEPVRYDGGHKLDHFLTDTLSGFVEYVPVCPEFEAGFGVPREAMRLVDDPESPRLMTIKSGVDLTGRMNMWIRKKLPELEKRDLCGFVFKSGSPSSGMERVKVYDAKGAARKTGAGLFAKAFMERFPLLPVEDEGRLHDIGIRENFIARVFAFHRWKQQLAADRSPAAVIEFYARHKYLLMAHSPAMQKDMGKLVARVKTMERGSFLGEFERLFMTALKYHATVKKNANVLMHMSGYFRKRLSADEKQELADMIERYRQELIPLVVPVTMIRHYVRKYGEEYLAEQYYLDPHPAELKLRNHA